MALQPGTLPNGLSLQYRVQMGQDEPQQGFASLQSCNSQVNLQVDEECFQIPYAVFEHIPPHRMIFGWIPDDHRPQEQKDELQDFRVVAKDKDGLQSAIKDTSVSKSFSRVLLRVHYRTQ